MNVTIISNLSRTLLCTAAMFALAGCQKPLFKTESKMPATAADLATSEPSEAGTASTDSSPLGEQAQRDVEELMRLRAKGPAAPAEPVAEPAPPTAEPAAAVAAAPVQQAPTAIETPLLSHGPAAPTTREESLSQLEKTLIRLAEESDDPLREAIILGALKLLERDAFIPSLGLGLTESERQVLKNLQDFFTQLSAELRTPNSAGTEEAIAAAAASLQAALSRPLLRLEEARLCWKVDGFSRFEPFSHHAFLAGAEQPLIVYVQVRDFATTQDGDGLWATRLSQQLVIYNARDGAVVWREDWQPAVDRTRGTRRDFFLTQVATLPKALSVGKYQLKVRVRDDQSKAEAETTIPFEMVADPRLAATAGK